MSYKHANILADDVVLIESNPDIKSDTRSYSNIVNKIYTKVVI